MTFEAPATGTVRSLVAKAGDAGFAVGLRVAEALIRHATRDGARAYFDASAFGWTVPLEAAWRDIRAELDAVLADRDRIPAFEDISEEQRAITNDGRWKVFVFFVFGTPVRGNCDRCPHTSGLLRGIPGLRNAMYSILAPGKRIPVHRGPYNGLLRYHLALRVPNASERCTIVVDGVRRGWQEGRTLVFDDSFPHAVDNDTDEERVLLFADFERPLPWPLARANRAVVDMLARTPLARGALERLGEGEA
jgi:beta-hydroxylase